MRDHPMTSPGASSSAALHSILPLAALLTACVIYEDDVDCNGNVCCDDYGCYNVDDDDDGYNPNTTSGTTSGGGGQGGAQGGAGGAGGEGGAGGAPPGCDDTLIVCACADTSECPEGLSCLDGQCLTACEFDYHCADGQVCADGQCTAACEVGVTPCAVGYQCVGGGCVVDPANPECVDATTCASGSCVNGFCTTTCDSNAACPPGQLCDAATSSCFPDQGPTPVCDAVTPCSGSGQECLDDGYCHYGCLTTEECKFIDARYDACDRGICKTDLELNPECTFELPCPEGTFCVSNECATPLPPQ